MYFCNKVEPEGRLLLMFICFFKCVYVCYMFNLENDLPLEFTFYDLGEILRRLLFKTFL